MRPDVNDILRQAVDRNAGVVLSLPSAGMMRHCKSRFLNMDDSGIWVESVPGERLLVEELIRTQKPAGLSFRNGETKVVAVATILASQPQFPLRDGVVVEALRLAPPQQIKAMQRRANYRVRANGEELRARMWRIGLGALLRDRPMAAQEIPIKLYDLSVGGMAVILPLVDGKPPRLSTEDRLRVELQYRDTVLLVEGCARHARAGNGDVRAGIQFKLRDDDASSRHTISQLTRIVGELQRIELRHYFLTAPATPRQAS